MLHFLENHRIILDNILENHRLFLEIQLLILVLMHDNLVLQDVKMMMKCVQNANQIVGALLKLGCQKPENALFLLFQVQLEFVDHQ